MRRGGLHGGVTALLSVIILAIGIAMLISTVVRGGGPLSYGVIVGLCFVAAGAARLWLALKGPMA